MSHSPLGAAASPHPHSWEAEGPGCPQRDIQVEDEVRIARSFRNCEVEILLLESFLKESLSAPKGTHPTESRSSQDLYLCLSTNS